MKLAPIPQNPLEWFALKAGLVPTPLAYSHFGFLISKIILEAVDKGVFEAVGHHQTSVDEVAATCNLNKKALQSLLGALASLGLIDYKNNRLILTKQAKKWLLKDSPNSLYWMMMFDNKVCLKWMDYVGEFLETGKGLQYHETFNDEEWFYYQKAMEATASAVSREIVSKIPIPPAATNMLDIGGSHGLYSIKLCKKYKGLQSIIFDLPAAVEKAKPLLEKHNMRQIKHVAGNILTDGLEDSKYDLVLMASVSHHFTADQNIAVAKKVFKALRPGGYFSIVEVLRHDKIQLNGDMLASMGDFFFALSSTSGAWSLKEIKRWQQEAGFAHHKKSTFLTIPGYVAITAVKK
jgi:SAM-dependent methyltransferase/predicted transcriptional regulator